MNESAATALRLTGITLFSVAAWCIYGLGLLAPLTPSEGLPRLVDLAIFFALPVLLQGTVYGMSRSGLARVLVGVQLAAIVGFELWLLSLQTGLARRLIQ